MPSTLRQARFPPVPATYSRLPRDDETYVMRAFARHSARCPSCADPYATHLAGGSLCPKGLQRALDVTQYVIQKAGRAFSVVDLELGGGGVRCEVEVPADCGAVRSLLKAVERGMRLRAKKQQQQQQQQQRRKKGGEKEEEERPAVVSYDESYYVAPRRVTPERELPSEQLRERESRYVEPEIRYVVPRGSGGSGGGSSARRFQQLKSQRPASYYEVGSRGRLPVPARGEWF